MLIKPDELPLSSPSVVEAGFPFWIPALFAGCITVVLIFNVLMLFKISMVVECVRELERRKQTFLFEMLMGRSLDVSGFRRNKNNDHDIN